MACPIRIEFENAVDQVTARGNERPHIYRDDKDRNRFLETRATEDPQLDRTLRSLVDCLSSVNSRPHDPALPTRIVV
jgi:hypothetical protein